jgi:uncharacterized protein YutE (UPF0331/DUF86 family)
MHVDDIILAKRTAIERCIAQIESYMSQRHDVPFATDYLTQDAVTMNIQRACESSIDIANRVVRLRRLGMPKSHAIALCCSPRQASSRHRCSVVC